MALRPLAADPSGQLALDANALSSLRDQAHKDPRAAVGKAAAQFEALFMQMLLKQMREAMPQDGPLSSDATKSYTAMFDQQIAQQLSGRGLGLKTMIERQLARHVEGAGATNPAGTEAPTGPTMQKPGTAGALSAFPIPATKSAVSGTNAPASAAPPAAPGSAPAKGASSGFLPAGVEAFVAKLRPHAEAVAKAMGVPAQYLLAQAGLETGWGKSVPRHSDGENSHNLFGIKAGTSWKGRVVEATTTEHVNGQPVKTVERFRAYGSFTEAFQDYANLLRSARYAGALAKAGDPRAYADGLQRAGYATDPHYGAKLAASIAFVQRKMGLHAPPPVQVTAGGADNRVTRIS